MSHQVQFRKNRQVNQEQAGSTQEKEKRSAEEGGRQF